MEKSTVCVRNIPTVVRIWVETIPGWPKGRIMHKYDMIPTVSENIPRFVTAAPIFAK